MLDVVIRPTIYLYMYIYAELKIERLKVLNDYVLNIWAIFSRFQVHVVGLNGLKQM